MIMYFEEIMSDGACLLNFIRFQTFFLPNLNLNIKPLNKNKTNIK